MAELKAANRSADPDCMRRRLATQDGFTLFEMTAAALVLVVGMLGTLTMISGANKRITENRAREGATNLAREVVEGARAVSYPDIVPASIESLIQLQPGLADSSPEAGWNVERRGITYTVKADSCIVDDDNPQDGVGDHTGSGVYCSNSATVITSPPDFNPDDYKRVSIRITYTRERRQYEVRQTAIINNPGSAFAPTVRSLTATGLTAPYKITNAATTSASFSALVTPRAKYVQWFVDNVKQGEATGPSVDTWSFTWNYGAGLSDGAYLVSARGFNTLDQSGADKTISVTLNRYAPARPATFAAGRNGSFGLEFDWIAAPDRDITAYRVYRMLGSAPAATDQLMCTRPAADPNPTSCVVSSDPGGDQRYYVVSVAPARVGTGSEESTRPTAAQTVLVTSNVAPNPPKTFSGTRIDNVVSLTWAAPDAPAGGEAGDSVAFYRIYRDGNNVSDRYGRIDPSSTSFDDTNPGAGERKYWVTAVDTHLRESTMVGPVKL